MDQEKIGNQMQTLAYGEALLAAAEAYKRDVIQESKTRDAISGHSNVDMQELLDDPELERLHADRLAELKQEAERRAKKPVEGHGTYNMIEEGDFLEVVTKTPKVVAHFCHPGFQRCLVMDKHLEILARRHPLTKFIKISAPEAPFFVQKLTIRVLPCVIIFIEGVIAGRIVGFQELGNHDTFQTSVLEEKLLQHGALSKVANHNSETSWSTIKKGHSCNAQRTASDEDSDFD